MIGNIVGGTHLSSTQLALAFVPGTELGVTEGLSSFETALLLRDFAWRLYGERRGKGRADAGGGGLEVITLYEFER